ncbi:hypothetical protein HanXRQr2_Chr14g0642951 [Helianthus annuus]|uniref:Uncharacterized protein n=1 Tax=Helianthus annuus TaxID=4232 RepID=A0A9K3H6J5_HELAN|nr:hypothetical protein HanXRQr2_Chr14g0642951 [Helianthus annuus]KAJ0840281.1 hypothetical protein HanPSC8_Chr14g0616831 [Helianthus annuus]
MVSHCFITNIYISIYNKRTKVRTLVPSTFIWDRCQPLISFTTVFIIQLIHASFLLNRVFFVPLHVFFLTLIFPQISAVSQSWFSPLFSIHRKMSSSTSKIYSSPSSQSNNYLDVQFLLIDFDLSGVKSLQSCVPHMRYFSLNTIQKLNCADHLFIMFFTLMHYCLINEVCFKDRDLPRISEMEGSDSTQS